MSIQAARYVKLEQHRISPEDAWKFWNQLSQLTDSLWEMYENEFLEFCMRDAEEQGYFLPQPFD